VGEKPRSLCSDDKAPGSFEFGPRQARCIEARLESGKDDEHQRPHQMVMPRQLDSCFRSNVAAWWCRTCLCCHDGPRFCFFVVWPRHPWCCSDSQQRVQIIASAGPLSTSSWPGAMPWAGWSQAKSDRQTFGQTGSHAIYTTQIGCWDAASWSAALLVRSSAPAAPWAGAAY
jgi:hypothetical protein